MSHAQLVDVPSSISINGQKCVVISTMENFHYRALVLPPLSGPVWLSNAEVAKLTAAADHQEEGPQ